MFWLKYKPNINRMTEIERKVRYGTVLLNAHWTRLLCWSAATVQVAVWTFVTSCLLSASQYKTDRTDDWFPKNFIIEIGREKVINLKKFFPTKCFYWYICLNLYDSLWSLTPGRWRQGLVSPLYVSMSVSRHLSEL